MILEAEHGVGRSADCRLRIAAGYVSAQHAFIRWTDDGWEVKDLASTNGTCVGGTRLRPGESRPLAAGDVLTFGHVEQRWEVVDDDPPQVLVVPADGGAPIVVDGDLLALPSAEEPRATIFRGRDGVFCVEQPDDDAIVRLEDGAAFEVAGRAYRFSCPAVVAPTQSTEVGRSVRDARLAFGVSRNEEHVEIVLEDGRGATPLAVRNHNYLLLVLARRRLADAEAKHPESSCGWIDKDELLDALGVTANQLNIDIFRLRKQFGALGFADAAHIVERRVSTKELRLGVRQVSVRAL